jgi:CheY-like chemotaxis protein
MIGDPISILLVEDDDIDAEAIKRAFKKQKIANPLTRVADGIEALALLRGEEQNRTLSSPYIILLDINMPRMNGHEFLMALREDKALHNCVVFVLTTSDSDRDIDQAYSQNVAGYILKSRVGEDFSNLTGLIDHYWRYIELPRIKS